MFPKHRGAQYLLLMLLYLAGCGSETRDSASLVPALIARVAPAVVAIGDDQQSLATAFFITPQILATSDHVLARQPLYMIGKSGKRTRLEMRVRDNAHDLALLETAAASPTALSLSKSLPSVGESVLALGNPFGGGITATRGIISALPDAIEQTALLQTDAAINPGNSGGPLINDAGEVLGMVVSRGVPGSGAGFAVPARQIELLLGRLDAADY